MPLTIPAQASASIGRRALLTSMGGAALALPVAARLRAATAPARPVRVLSIDGGGMRGIIPGRVLQEIEARSGKRVAELFDVVVGTSTGALLSLGAAVPGDDGRPAYSAQDLVGLYEEAGPTIFHKSRGVRACFAGLVRPTYDPAGFEGLLEKCYGWTALSQELVEVAVPTISLETTSLEVFPGAPPRAHRAATS